MQILLCAFGNYPLLSSGYMMMFGGRHRHCFVISHQLHFQAYYLLCYSGRYLNLFPGSEYRLQCAAIQRFLIEKLYNIDP